MAPTGEKQFGGKELQCACGNRLGLANFMHISKLAAGWGRGERSFQMLTSAMPTCHKEGEVVYV
jgi:hypothetical protein